MQDNTASEHEAVNDYRQALRERCWVRTKSFAETLWIHPSTKALHTEAEAFAMLSAEMGPGVQAGQAEREEAMRDD